MKKSSTSEDTSTAEEPLYSKNLSDPSTRKNFIKELACRVKNGELVLFSGAGVSASAGLPSWSDLLSKLPGGFELDIEDVADFPLYAQYYVNKCGDFRLKEGIAASIPANYGKESSLLAAIAKLNFKTIWTSNYDEIIEKLIDIKPISRETQLPNLIDPHKARLYKLHGDINHLENIIITKDDFEKHKQPLMDAFFKRDLVIYPFLFLGCSFTDQLILKKLSEIHQCLGYAMRCHYTIMVNKKAPYFPHLINDLYKRYNIETLVVENREEIANVLNEIHQKSIEKNVFISGSLVNPDKETRDYAYHLCRELSEALLIADCKIISGFGNKIGRYLMAHSICWLHENNKKEKHRYVEMSPFADEFKPQQKKEHRQKMIANCNFSIFIFGESVNCNLEHKSLGVNDEFIISKDLKKFIIPIGVTGYETLRIWEEVTADDTGTYWYLEKHKDTLKNESDSKVIAECVVDIILDVLSSEHATKC